MSIKLFLSIAFILHSGSVFASHFEFCTFNGRVFGISTTDRPLHSKGIMKILSARQTNDLGYTDCQDFIGNEHTFLFNSEKLSIAKDDLIEIEYRYWEDINGIAHENWAIENSKK